MSDNCFIAAIRDTRIPKVKPCCITKRDTKHLSEQSYRHLNFADWSRFLHNTVSDVKLAWSFLAVLLMSVIYEHVPYKRYSVKGWGNPWFSEEFADLIVGQKEETLLSGLLLDA